MSPFSTPYPRTTGTYPGQTRHKNNSAFTRIHTNQSGPEPDGHIYTIWWGLKYLCSHRGTLCVCVFRESPAGRLWLVGCGWHHSIQVRGITAKEPLRHTCMHALMWHFWPEFRKCKRQNSLGCHSLLKNAREMKFIVPHEHTPAAVWLTGEGVVLSQQWAQCTQSTSIFCFQNSLLMDLTLNVSCSGKRHQHKCVLRFFFLGQGFTNQCPGKRLDENSI